MAIELRELYTEFEDVRMNYNVCFLKINRLLDLKRLISNLFHSMIVDGKEEALKMLSFVLKKKGKLETLLAICNKCLTGIKLKRY